MNRVHPFHALLAAAMIASFAVSPAHATHAWGSYHWARTANPFTVKVADNVSSAWDSYLNSAAASWSSTSGPCVSGSNPVRAVVVASSGGSPRRCSPTSGMITACNTTYGNNGWLGLASIWASGDHITQGTVKLNDTYFNTSTYNTPAWRSMVCAQEVGHCFGLGHQDENFSNADVLDACGIASCMDYSNNPAGQCCPNGHDYDQLVSIYGHLDSFTTLASGLPTEPSLLDLRGRPGLPDIDTENEAEWGTPVGFNARGRADTFVRDLGFGVRLITHVFWID